MSTTGTSARAEPGVEVASRRRPALRAVVSGPTAVLLIVLFFSVLLVDGFASPSNILNILRSVSFTGIVATGMTFVILGGYYADLSVPAAISTGAIVVLTTMSALGPVLAAIVAVVAAGVIGVANGALVALLKGNPIVVTLGTQTVVSGLLLWATDGSFAYGTSKGFQAFGKSQLLGIPVQVALFLLMAVLAQLFLSRMRYGHELTAAGANRPMAHAVGLPTRAIGLSIFVVSAGLAGVAGVLIAAFTNQANLSAGAGFEFSAIAAVVVGGTSLYGGVGSVTRTIVGVLLIGVVDNCMILLGVPFESRLLVTGLAIVIAVGLDMAQRHRGERS